MSEAIVPKKLMYFCLNHIVKSVAYSKGLGVHNEVLGYHIPYECYEEIRSMIKNEEFPNGYYEICDEVMDMLNKWVMFEVNNKGE